MKTGHLTVLRGGVRWLSYLITGPYVGRESFCCEVWPDCLESREETTRFRVYLLPEETPEQAEDKLIEAARKADITLQRLVDLGPSDEPGETHDLGGGASATVGYRQEEYPVAHLATHGQRWGDG